MDEKFDEKFYELIVKYVTVGKIITTILYLVGTLIALNDNILVGCIVVVCTALLDLIAFIVSISIQSKNIDIIKKMVKINKKGSDDK